MVTFMKQPQDWNANVTKNNDNNNNNDTPN